MVNNQLQRGHGGRKLCPKCGTEEGVHGGCNCGYLAAKVPPQAPIVNNQLQPGHKMNEIEKTLLTAIAIAGEAVQDIDAIHTVIKKGWSDDCAALREEINYLKDALRTANLMIENGLGPKDMERDCE